MAELERTFTVMAGAEAAFDYLSDPIHLPEYVAVMRLEDSIAVEGELDADADLKDRDGASEAGFVADRATRRIEWGRPGSDYGGAMAIAAGTTSTASVTLQLRTRADADEAEVTRVFDQAIANIRRRLMTR